MQNQINLLRLIADGQLYSGEELGRALGISRAAICKNINSLNKLGVSISSQKGQGYRLLEPIELFDHQTILSKLTPAAKKHLQTLEIFNSVHSTNQYLLELDNLSSKHGHVVLAEHQTQGRGRRGNSWVSPFASGICLSLAWHFDDPVESLNCLSLAVGSSIVKALDESGVTGIGLKWPNDIYSQDKKLGGILIDVRGELGGCCDIVIGVGLNYSFSEHSADDISQPWIDLKTITPDISSRSTVAANLISELLNLMGMCHRLEVEEIVGTWQQHDCMHNKPVYVQLQNKRIEGIAKGIADDGNLLVDVSGQTRKFAAAEVSLRAQS